MELSMIEREMLDGQHGEAVQTAIAYQQRVGEFWGARRFVPISNAHMMGDIEVMGDGGLAWLKAFADKGTPCRVNVTTNARCVDFAHCDRLGQTPSEVGKERELIQQLRRLEVATTDTCINYQTVYQPHLGEHVAWGDTGTVIYANSVLGARSNFEAGPAALAAAITGRTPEYGFHLDAHRRASFAVRIDAQLKDLADWGLIGKLVGQSHQNYYAVPVFHSAGLAPRADELKHLGAALASYGSMGMFHFVGVTPEAPSLEAAFAGQPPPETMIIDDAALTRAYADFGLGDGDARLVVFSGPQLSLFELKGLADLFEGRHVAAGSQCFVTTSAAVLAHARSIGYAGMLEAAGVTILEGVCFYILQNLSAMRERNGWTNMVSNSAKLVNIIGAHRFNTILRTTPQCVDIACTGMLA